MYWLVHINTYLDSVDFKEKRRISLRDEQSDMITILS